MLLDRIEKIEENKPVATTEIELGVAILNFYSVS